MDYLETTDFYTCPGSTRFHHAHKAGLALHNLQVLFNLRKLFKNVYDEKYYEEKKESIVICALLHDMCKINCYKAEQRNRKNEKTGQWEKYDFMTFADDTPLAPHGSKSALMCLKHIALTDEEMMAISWHAGAFSANSAEMSSFMTAARLPLVMMLHTADMMSSTGYNDVYKVI